MPARVLIGDRVVGELSRGADAGVCRFFDFRRRRDEQGLVAVAGRIVSRVDGRDPGDLLPGGDVVWVRLVAWSSCSNAWLHVEVAAAELPRRCVSQSDRRAEQIADDSRDDDASNRSDDTARSPTARTALPNGAANSPADERRTSSAGGAESPSERRCRRDEAERSRRGGSADGRRSCGRGSRRSSRRDEGAGR